MRNFQGTRNPVEHFGMWDLIFNWPALVERGYDAATYAIMAGVGTLLFLVRLGFAMIGGGEGDFDTGADGDFDSDTSFTYFSVLSILAFFMGTGWMGLACRLDWGLGSLPSALIASAFGASMMLTASGLAYATRRLNRTIDYDMQTAVGRTGRVYLTIPAKGQGHGQVEVSVSGRRKVVRATSTGDEIAAFADVKVLEVRDDDTLVVEPLG